MSEVAGTQAGGNASSSTAIKMNIENFNTDVDTIETTGTTIIDDSADTPADAAITRNVTVPTYVTFDERIENALRNLETETQQTVGSLRKISKNYCDVDTDATTTITEKGNNVPAASK